MMRPLTSYSTVSRRKESDMGERRFYIREFDKDGFIANVRDGITESELIRRLNIICDEMHSPKKSINILLHGEQKEE